MERIKEIGEQAKLGNYDECIEIISMEWDNLPEPKEKFPNNYLLIEYGARISLKKNDYDGAWMWALRGLIFNETRGDGGESEFLIGKVAFEKNDLGNAKKYFLISYEKSKGRAFEGENPKYRELVEK